MSHSPLAVSDRIRTATLHELALHTPQPAVTAAFYSKALGYRFTEDGQALLGTANARRLRLIEGPAKTLAYATYTVESESEFRDLEERLRESGTAYSEVFRDDLAGAALRFSDPDGNQFIFGRPAAGQGAATGDDVGNRPARLQHVVFASTNAAGLLDFYTDVLGFTLSDRVVDGEGGLRTAFVRCSPEHHSLAVFSAHESRLDHHCMEAGDWMLIRDWADHFASEHIPLKWGPGRHGPGNNLFIFVHDPDGNWVELSAEIEQVEDGKAAGEWPHEERTLNSWGIGMLRS